VSPSENRASSSVEKFPDLGAPCALLDGLSTRVYVLGPSAVLQKEKDDLPLLILGLRGATPSTTGTLDCQVQWRRTCCRTTTMFALP
jgi:hypothetical protein